MVLVLAVRRVVDAVADGEVHTLRRAEMRTFFAPAARCAAALSLAVNNPLHSSTICTPSAPHGSFGRVPFAQHPHRASVDDQRILLDTDRMAEASVHGVVFQQIAPAFPHIVISLNRHELRDRDPRSRRAAHCAQLSKPLMPTLMLIALSSEATDSEGSP